MHAIEKLIINQPYSQERNPNLQGPQDYQVFPHFGHWVPIADYEFVDANLEKDTSAICQYYDKARYKSEKNPKVKMAMETIYNKGWGCTECTMASRYSTDSYDTYYLSTIQVPGYDIGYIPLYGEFKAEGLYLIRKCIESSEAFDISNYIDNNNVTGQSTFSEYFTSTESNEVKTYEPRNCHEAISNCAMCYIANRGQED